MKDPELLEGVAVGNRILMAHDRRTMLNHFRNRLPAGLSSPGLLVAAQDAPNSSVVEAILVLWSVFEPDELRDQAYHLPFIIRHVFPR